jgi:tellurite resistance protein
MDTRQIEAIGAICVMAALSDGATSPTERERIDGVFKGLQRVARTPAPSRPRTAA